MKRFQDRTVIVTGGGGGIGSATCRRFAQDGARVAVFDIDDSAAGRVSAEIRAAGGQAEAIRCDITSRADVDAAVATAIEKLGPIDILVNNAGWDIFRPFLKTEPAQRPSSDRSRWAASGSPTTCPARSCSSPATTRATSPARC